MILQMVSGLPSRLHCCTSRGLPFSISSAKRLLTTARAVYSPPPPCCRHASVAAGRPPTSPREPQVSPDTKIVSSFQASDALPWRPQSREQPPLHTRDRMADRGALF